MPDKEKVEYEVYAIENALTGERHYRCLNCKLLGSHAYEAVCFDCDESDSGAESV